VFFLIISLLVIAEFVARAFPVGIESEGFPTAVAWANLGEIDSPGELIDAEAVFHGPA
jgi:hypothetical protein